MGLDRDVAGVEEEEDARHEEVRDEMEVVGIHLQVACRVALVEEGARHEEVHDEMEVGDIHLCVEGRGEEAGGILARIYAYANGVEEDAYDYPASLHRVS